MASTETLAQRVKALRKERGWRQEELAKRAELSQPAVSRIERGFVQQPRADVLRRLSEALGVTVDFLIKTKGNASEKESVIIGEYKTTLSRLDGSSLKQVLEYARFLEAQQSNRKRAGRDRK